MKKNNSVAITLKVSLVILAVIGLLDASYLTFHHYTNSSLICTSSCDAVLKSSYSVVFGIPVALFGVFYYLLVLAMSLLFLIRKTFSFYLLAWASIGLVTTTYLLIVQGFVLHTWCRYCILSAMTSITIFLASIFLAQHTRKTKLNEAAGKD